MIPFSDRVRLIVNIAADTLEICCFSSTNSKSVD
nr:MAG TPA: hypothetical protein [Caudoviricetes sp.]